MTMEQARENAVWERVRAGRSATDGAYIYENANLQSENAAEPPQNCEHTVTPEKIGEWVCREWENAEMYRHLAGRLPPCARQCLMEMAADEKEHARRLSAHYYAVTGGCVNRQGSYTPVCCPMETLRRQYEAELANAQTYGDAARCAEGMLAELLDELSRDEARHSRMVMYLLERVI